MTELKRTVLYDRHLSLGAKMVEFGGWEMPVYYPTGIIEEHLATHKGAGLFDISHMGRFVIRGNGALTFLQHVLANNAEAIDPRIIGAQYTLIPTETGGAVDDAYLYRFVEDEYLLVVNAANREKDWEHFQGCLSGFKDVELVDRTEQMAMLSLQGPKSRECLQGILESGSLPEPMRNTVRLVTIAGAEVKLARTGYTGEPICFELFADRDVVPVIWEALAAKGATPAGLGARDTLRLEAGLALFGHELGQDPEGREIPILAYPNAKIGVSFSPLKNNYVGRFALLKQFKAFQKIMFRDYSMIHALPRMIQPVALMGRGKGVQREQIDWLCDERHEGSPLDC